ncbi:hypothetical protein L2E82_49875 [Cichorium intybus]|uniref:Uncharacterized protein n=1 Tax=Cichorium intybus TaxID=13427 RepID=A0ACB8Z1K9_CICIN|nr:hypothetical protein L2E82_49875 [Cichorium intybus]
MSSFSTPLNLLRRLKDGESVHSHETNVLSDSEEENDWDSEDQFSDDDLLLSSDDARQEGFSDEEEDPLNLEVDEHSFGRNTEIEEGITPTNTRDLEKREQEVMGVEIDEEEDLLNIDTDDHSFGRNNDFKDRIIPTTTRDKEQWKQEIMGVMINKTNEIPNKIKKAEDKENIAVET